MRTLTRPEPLMARRTLALFVACLTAALLSAFAAPCLAAAAPGRQRPAPPVSAQQEYVCEFDTAVYPFLRINFRQAWYPEYYSGAHGGQLYVSSGNSPDGSNDHASVQVFFRGSYVKLVCARYWQCGWCEVFLDGKSQGRFNLFYDNTQAPYEPEWDHVVFEADNLRPGVHNIRVVNLGMVGSEDEIANEYDLHFVNVDYLVVR